MLVETNAPATLKVLISQAQAAIEEKTYVEATKILQDADDTATLLLDWFRFLQQAGVNLPMGWTEFIHMRMRKQKGVAE